MSQIAVFVALSCAALVAAYPYRPDKQYHHGHGTSYVSRYDDHSKQFQHGGYSSDWQGSGHHDDWHHHPSYKFEYGVKDPHTHDHHSQWEHRDGDTVHGEYTLDEADGTKRVVKYSADGKTGFHAHVERIGKAKHDHGHHHQHNFDYTTL